MGRIKARRKNGMLLVMALALLFILTLLASSLIFMSQSSRSYVMRAYKENLDEQCINIIQTRIADEIQGPMPSPDPSQNSWSSVRKDINTTPLPDPIPPIPSPSPSPFDVHPENNKKHKLSGEMMSRPIPNTAGVDTDDIPQVGYQDSDKFPKLKGDGIPPWHTLASLSTSNKKKYKTMYSPAFPFGAYAPNGSINLWSAKGYTNPSISEMTKNKWNDKLSYSGVPVNMYAKDNIRVYNPNKSGKDNLYPFGKAYVSSKQGKIILPGGSIGFKREFLTDYSLIYLKQIVNAYHLISDVAINKSDFLYAENGETYNTGNLLEKIISSNFLNNVKHILSMQQAQSFPFYTIITIKEDAPGIEFRVFFHLPDLTDGSKVPSKKNAEKIKEDMEVLKELAEPWANFPTKDDNKIDWSKVPNPYDNQAFYQDIKGLIQWIKDNKKYPKYTVDPRDQYACHTWNEMQDIFKNKFYQEYHITVDNGTNSETYKIDANSEEEAKEEAIRAFMAKYGSKKVKVTVDSNKHWLIKKSDLKQLYFDDTVVADYWNRQIENLEQGSHGEKPADINKLTMKEEIDLLDGTDDKDGCDGTNYYKLLKKGASFFKDIITFHIKDALKDLGNNIRVVHFQGGPYDMSVFRDKYNGKLTVSMPADWTVPRGRTLKLDCNLNMKGDLWIQDGATLYITGYLNVQNPGGGDDSGDAENDFRNDIEKGIKAVFRPTGRVFLGKGSTLMVGDNFSCQGTPYRGSIVVDSEVGEVNFITSGIICKGNVSIPHGVIPGVSFSSLGDMLQGKHGNLGKFLNDMEYIPSQVAKVFGPFHRRYCCIAKTPDPWMILDIPIIDIFIFFPFPVSEVNNMNIDVFRTLTYGYTVVLNATLGENLFTDSSWWPFGMGGVPMLPKVGGIELMPEFFSGFTDFKDFEKEILNDIKSFLSTATIEKLAETLLIKLLNKVIEKAITSVLDFVPSFISNAISNLLGAGIDSLLSNLVDISNRIDPTEQLEKIKDKMEEFLKQKLENSLTFKFYETSGALIYADKNLKIGDENQKDGDCLFASGLFVAHGNIESHADRTVGCLISVNGNISARDFLFYPYFTRASLNIPKNKSLWVALLDPLLFKTDKYPVDIGVKLQHISGEGWGK